MPTYDYRCRTCGHRFEFFQSMSEPAKRRCPACGKMALDRLIGTGAALIFKGSGFYQTDYRSDSYKKAAEADKPAESAKPAETSKPGEPAKTAEKTAPTPEPAVSKPDTSRRTGSKKSGRTRSK